MLFRALLDDSTALGSESESSPEKVDVSSACFAR